MSPPPRRRETFKVSDPPRVVRDHTLGGTPVLLLGWWLNESGREVGAQVATMTSFRQPYDISDFPIMQIRPKTQEEKEGMGDDANN